MNRLPSCPREKEAIVSITPSSLAYLERPSQVGRIRREDGKVHIFHGRAPPDGGTPMPTEHSTVAGRQIKGEGLGRSVWEAWPDLQILGSGVRTLVLTGAPRGLVLVEWLRRR